MNQSVSAGANAPRNQPSAAGAWPAYLVVVLVVAAAIYAFSPRPAPHFPPTQIHPDQLLVTGLAQSGNRIVAVGEDGHILIADHPDGPWREATVKPQRGSTFTKVAFVGSGVALAVGHDGWIVRSQDNGETWNEVNFDSSDQAAPLFGIAGPFAGKLFVFGAFGQCLSSTDLGKTWQKVTDPAIADHHLYALVRATNGALLMAGERGLLSLSQDNGATWKKLTSIYPGSFFGALALPSGRLLVFGMRGHAFYSDDTGATWHASEIPDPVSMFGGAVTAQGEVILVGEGSSVQISKDGGAHFVLASQGELRNLAAVLPLPGGGLLTGGEGGIALQKLGTGAVSQKGSGS
ncbi:MAG: WD40/YVTN/BNR-like repeat-containing protein [Stenotrophobium sp.]